MMTFSNNGAFFLDGLGPDNSAHDLNSGLSSLSLSSTIPQGPMKPQLGSMSPSTALLDGSFQGFLQQAPSTPVFHQHNHPQPARNHSLDINDPRMGAGNIGAFPTNFSPSVGWANQRLSSPPPGDFIGSFLHTPNLNNSPNKQGGLASLDNFNPGLSTLAPRGLLDPAPISPTKPTGNEIGRVRSYSTPEYSYNQFPRGAMPSPASASTNQMSSLYEDKPLLSPSGFDWQNSRPPRHESIGSMRDNNPSLLLPRPGMMRHAVSDGSFNSQLQLGAGSPSFEASLQKVQLNSTTSFGSLGADSNSSNEIPVQHQMHMNSNQMPQGMPPRGFLNTNQQGFMCSNSIPPGLGHGNFVPQEQLLIHHGHPPNYPRHNSTGSAHFLVNERGEIIGHSSLVHHVMPQPGPNFPPPRQHPMGHVGAPVGGNFVHHPPPFPPFNDGANKHGHLAGGQMQMGSIGDGRKHQRNSTEPIMPPTFIQVQVSDGSVSSGQCQHRVSSDLSQTLSSGAFDDKEEEPAQVVAPSAGQPQSYASKLMTAPRAPPPVEKVSALPATAATGGNVSKAGQKMIYTVKFKRSQRAFKLNERVTREVKIGCYVKVEADRGEDLGIVTNIVPVEKYLAKPASDDEEQPVSSQVTSIGDMKRIMRAATNDEIALLEVKKEEEDELLKICTTKARQRGLPMTVVDAEYQFDRHKLTFFFEAEGRIDFRELVRDLFSIYKTRIWMQQVNKDECEGKAQ